MCENDKLRADLATEKAAREKAEAKLEQSKKLYEMTLNNEIRWMQKHEKAEQERDAALEVLKPFALIAQTASKALPEGVVYCVKKDCDRAAALLAQREGK